MCLLRLTWCWRFQSGLPEKSVRPRSSNRIAPPGVDKYNQVSPRLSCHHQAAVVQATSGEAFGFTFKPNSNKGKVRATEGMSDEWGETRDRMGYFDTCSVEAVRLDNEAMAQIRLELEKAKNTTTSRTEDDNSSISNRLERVQGVGKTILARFAPSRVDTKT